MNVAINGGNPLEVEWQDFIVANDIRRLKTVKKLSELLLERQSRLLGHVMRRDENELLRQPSFDQNLARPYQLKRRTGRPKLNWISLMIQLVQEFTLWQHLRIKV